MFVCMSVGMWSANGNLDHCTDLDKILHADPHLSKKVQFWSRPPHPPGPGGPETLKAEGHILKTVYKTKDV